MVYAFVCFAFPRLDRLLPFLVALLFVVHPLHVEVVANIKGRDEILALFFGLASVVLLVKALESLSWSLLLAGTACFVAACLSKTNAVTLLPLVALVAWYRASNPRMSRRLVASMAAIGLCSLALVQLIRHLQSTVSTDTPLHLSSTVLNNIFLWTARPETIVPTALVIVARYAALFLFPHPLIHLYGHDQVPLNEWGDLSTWLVLAGLVLVGVALYKTWSDRLPLAFGIVCFAVTYSVYSNLLFYAPDTMADRYMFMPSIGLALIALHGVFKLASLDFQSPAVTSVRAKTVVALFAAVLVALAARTVIANRDWRNDSTLIHNRIRYMENNAAAQAIYGHILNKESAELGSDEMKRERKAAAMQAFAQAINIYPDFQAAWIATGKLFAERGVYEKAELAFFKAQRLEPLNPGSYFCLGTLYLAQQNRDLAIPYLEKAVLLDPKMEEAYVMLGKAYLQADNLENLGSMATTAREWFPNNTELGALLATYYFRRQAYRQAVDLARGVIARDPNNVLAMTILASPIAQEF